MQLASGLGTQPLLSRCRRLIERELGVPFNELFEQFDERPIGSGVQRCAKDLHDGHTAPAGKH
jgi:hypothetical protein